MFTNIKFTLISRSENVHRINLKDIVRFLQMYGVQLVRCTVEAAQKVIKVKV